MKNIKGKKFVGYNLPSEFYDKAFLERAKGNSIFPTPKIIGYKKVREAVWFSVKVPTIEPVCNCDDYECELNHDRDIIIIRMVEKKLFKIGWKWVKEPIFARRRRSKKTISFKRYSSLEGFVPKEL